MTVAILIVIAIGTAGLVLLGLIGGLAAIGLVVVRVSGGGGQTACRSS